MKEREEGESKQNSCLFTNTLIVSNRENTTVLS